MKNLRVAIFGGVLAGFVVFAVSGMVAQTRSEPGADVRVWPGMMMFDGQGGQLGVQRAGSRCRGAQRRGRRDQRRGD